LAASTAASSSSSVAHFADECSPSGTPFPEQRNDPLIIIGALGLMATDEELEAAFGVPHQPPREHRVTEDDWHGLMLTARPH
jgi:hypothetical protein